MPSFSSGADLTEGRSPAAPVPVLDLAAALDRLAGLESLYLVLAQEFIQELDTVVPQYRRLLGASALPDARRLMHSLKGSSATLGAARLGHMAATLEALCKDTTDNTLALAQAQTLEATVQSTRTALLEAIRPLQQNVGNDRA
jgi:HPt (histidine-containing phosphotransfer) domain-containing protein